MSQQEPPKIEFPCENYPIKIVGEAIDDYDAVMIDIVRVHAGDFDLERIRVQESSNGRFRSLTIYITATGTDQLVSIHRDLTAHPNVRMVI